MIKHMASVICAIGSLQGGYDELVEENQAYIQDEVDAKKEEIQKDLEKDIHDMFKKAFKGNKYYKIK